MKNETLVHTLSGTLTIDSHTIENAECRLYYNPLNTSDSRCEIFNTHNGLLMLCQHALVKHCSVIFETRSPDNIVKWHGRIKGIAAGRKDAVIAEALVYNIWDIYIHNNDSVQKVCFEFNISYNSMFERRRARHNHARYGALYGWDEDSNGWSDEVRSYTKEDWKIDIGPYVIFIDNDEESLIVRDQIKVFLRKEKENIESMDAEYENAVGLLNSIVFVLSLLECRIVTWRTCEIFCRSGDEIAVYGTAYNTSKNPKYNRLQELTKDILIGYHDSFFEIVQRHYELDAENKERLASILGTYLSTSNESLPIEIVFVNAQSSLEMMFNNILQRRRPKGFSKRLLEACKKMSVEWKDLWDDIPEEDIVGELQKNFPIAEIRNAIMHEGEIPSDTINLTLFMEISRARELLRRLVVKYIGVISPLPARTSLEL